MLVLYDCPDDYSYYSVKQIIDRLEVEASDIERLVLDMRQSGFNRQCCTELLNKYHGRPYAWLRRSSPLHNYYYVLTMPELRAAEVALIMLQLPAYNMDVRDIRRRVDDAKQKIWVNLPDFYKGHQDPMLKPLNYEAAKPYPNTFILEKMQDNGFRTKKLGHYAWMYELSKGYFSRKSEAAENFRVINNKYSCKLVSQSGAECIYGGEYYYSDPYTPIPNFVFDVMTNNDAAYMLYDLEGDDHYIMTAPGKNNQTVRVLIFSNYLLTDEGKKTYKDIEKFMFKGTFNRWQFCQEMLKVYENDYMTEMALAHEIGSACKKVEELM